MGRRCAPPGQLLVVGWALALILEPGRPVAWAWLWVVAMILVAGFTVRRRAPEVPSALLLSLTSMAAVAIVSLSVIFGLGIFPVEARTIVPLAGMMIGNSMAATVLAGRRVVGELRDNRREVEARLALGQPGPEAARPMSATVCARRCCHRSSRPRWSASSHCRAP